MRYPVKNFVRCLFSNFILKKPIPLFISLEVTRRCNAKCPFCGYWRLREPELSIEEIKEILDDAYDLGCSISVITGGEPLLRRDLSSILEYTKEIGLGVILLSNGYLLKDRVHDFYNYVDAVNTSIDFPDSRHDKNRGLNGLLTRAVSGIKFLRAVGIATNINCVVTGQHSLEDVRRILFLAKELDSQFTFSPVFITPHQYPHGSILGETLEKDEKVMRVDDWDIVKSVADMLLSYRKHGFRETIQNSGAYLKLVRDKGGFTCFPFSFQFAVSSNGTVSAVCPASLFGSHNLGNALKQNLKDIWYSKEAEMLRDKFKKCRLSESLGCYLFCVAEPSLPFTDPTTIIDYVRKGLETLR